MKELNDSKKPSYGAEVEPRSIDLDEDPLPLQDIGAHIREQGGGPLEWHDQLRSRLRVARNLTIYGPWAVVGAGLMSTLAKDAKPGFALPLAATACLILQSIVASFFTIPRTNELLRSADPKWKELKKLTLQNQRTFHLASLIILGPLASLYCLYRLAPDSQHELRLTAIMAFSFVVWWAAFYAYMRIHGTYVSFMRSMIPPPRAQQPPRRTIGKPKT